MIDNQICVETPESIQLHLIPVGPVPRIMAYTIDWLIRMTLLMIISFPLFSLNEAGSGVYLILYFVLEWFYSVFFEMLNNGMTPGKKAMGIQVVHDDGTPLIWGASILRNILRAVDVLPFGYLFAIISMVSSDAFKRIGDHAAGTLVVYRPALPQQATLSEVGSRPVPFPLDLDEQQAILAFAERSTQLSPSRQQELADILTPVLPLPVAIPADTASQARVSELKKIANGIIGQS